MASRTLKVEFVGDTRDLEKAFKKTSSVAGKTERDLGSLAKSGQRSMNHLRTAALGATAAVGTGLVAGLFASLKVAREAEVSQAKLAAQVKASGLSYRAHAAEIDKVIQKTAQLAAVDDEDLQDSFTNILRVTGNVKQSLGLVGLAADVARAKHIQLAKAGELVGKVAGGNTGILSRYGIQIKKGTTATEALGLMHKKFAGQAAAYGKTSAGAIDRARNAVENLGENIGQTLAPLIGKAANATAKFVDQIRTGTGAGGQFRDVLQGVYDKVQPIAKFFADHPKLIAVAIGAWAAYKVASLAALAAIKVQTFRKAFAKSVPVAGEEGAAAGAAYATGFDTTSAAGVGRAAKGGKLRTALLTAGKALGAAAGIIMAEQLLDKLGTSLSKYGSPDKFAAAQKKPVQDFITQTIAREHTPIKAPTGPRSPAARGSGGKAKTSGVRAHTSRVTARASGVRARASAAVYGHDQLMALWVKAGGPPEVADMAAAIALAESGGNAGIVNSIGATGLWQIHPGGSQYLDPMANARAAVAKYRGAGNKFTPWTTYTGYDTPGHRPTYGQFLTGGAAAPTASAPAARATGPSAASKARTAFGKSQGRARVTHAGALGGAIERAVNSTAGVEGAQAYTEAVQADPSIAVGGGTHPGLAIGMAKVGEIAKIQKRLKTIRRLLRGKHLTRAQRTRLLQEVPGLEQRLTELSAPPDLPTGDTGTGTGEDPNQPLIDALAANTAAAEAQAEALKNLQGEVKGYADTLTQIRDVDTSVLKTALADAVSGSIGGRVLRGLGTPAFAGGRMVY